MSDDIIESVKDGATKKLGPLPIWGWAGIAVVGIFFILPKLRGGASSPAPVSASIADPGPLNTAGSNATTTLSGQLTDLQGTDSSILQTLTSFANSPTNTPVAQAPTPTGPSFSADVQNIYTDLLGRPVGSADLAGEEYWQGRGLDQLHTLLAVEGTPEAQHLATVDPVAYVKGQYAYTGQGADQGGLDYWSRYITQHGAVQEANAFANSTAAARGQKPVV